MYALRLNQSWGMFAPTVFREDGWLVLEAHMNDGTVVDLNLPNEKISFDKPAYVLSRFKNDRWRKYTEQIFVTPNAFLRPYYVSYLKENYNKHSEGKKVESINVYYMLERTPLIGKQPTIEKLLLYTAEGNSTAEPIKATPIER